MDEEQFEKLRRNQWAQVRLIIQELRLLRYTLVLLTIVYVLVQLILTIGG